ncbi:MAG TPA: glycosyltransferase [Bacteroidia bacterium]|nr:glycosyltransferase [Bacteroidia bacterium]
MKQKLHIILPAYNEALNLPNLLGRIENFSAQVPYLDMTVFVINDGSTDNTSNLSKDFPMSIRKIVVDLNPNRGLAGAMRAGIGEGMKGLSEQDVLVALDADDSHNPFLIERMLKQINEGSDVVIASRYQKGSRIYGLTKFRKFTSWSAGILFRVLLPVKGVKDYTSGFRAYKAKILRKAINRYGEKFIQEQGFACMAEVLLKLAKEKAIIHEVPFILRYDRKKGSSKMKVIKTVRETINLIFKYH